MNREYYSYWYRFNNEDSFLIWFSDEKDGVVVDENGFVPSFGRKSDLKNYSEKNQIEVDLDNPNMTNLDTIKNWLDNGGKIEDYNLFLNSWNLFDDISISIKGNFDEDKSFTNDIYNRIFWGCNIPAVTPEGESFTPTWTKKELKIIHKILNSGLRMFKEKIKHQ